MLAELIQAIEKRNIAEALKLIEKIPQKNLSDRVQEGKSALHLAAELGQEQIIKSLLDRQPNLVDLKDNSDKTALDYAKEKKLLKEKTEIETLLTIAIIQHRIELGNQEIIGTHSEAILVIGKTGAGKSTLVNYLTDPSKLEIIKYIDPKVPEDRGKLVLEVKNDYKDKAPKLGHTKNSETFIPSKWQAPNSEIIYWDCPGFGDTAGPEKDIPNAFFIKRIFDTTNKIKLLLVINYEDLIGSRATEIKTLTETLGNLFKNFDDIQRSISLVVTNTKKTSADEETGNETRMPIAKEDIQSEIKKNLNADCFKVDSVGKKILELFSRQENKIASFERPQVVGDFNKPANKSLLGNNINILNTIKSTEFANKPNINIAISDESKNTVNELVKEISKKITDIISTEIKDELIKYCKTTIEETKKFSDLESILLEKFQQQITAITKSNTYQEVLTTIEALENIIKIRHDLKGYIESIKFLETINPNNKQSVKGWDEKQLVIVWVENLNNIIKAIDQLFKTNKHLDKNTLIIEGGVINAKEVMENFRSYKDEEKKEIKEMRIFAYNTIFFNQNLEDQNLKGKDLSIIAPRWKIAGEYRIDISGKNGENHKTVKAINGAQVKGNNKDGTGKDGESGQDGMPGLPGGAGGNFFGIGKKFYNLKNLTINVSGGKGGKGQDGGDGSNGTNSVSFGSKEDVQNRLTKTYVVGKGPALVKSKLQDGSISTSLDAQSTVFYPLYERYTIASDYVEVVLNYYKSKGGDGGKGGTPGASILMAGVALADLEIIQLNGAHGTNGDGGKGGKPGTSKDYHGVYINAALIHNFNEAKDLTKVAIVVGLVATGIAGIAGIAAGGIPMLIASGVGSGVAHGIGFTGALGIAGIGTISLEMLKTIGYTGWQGEIVETVSMANNGAEHVEKNIQGLIYPTEPKFTIDRKKVIECYKAYQEIQIDKKNENQLGLFIAEDFILDVNQSSEVTNVDNNNQHNKFYLQPDLASLDNKTTKIAPVHSLPLELNPNHNAFNQRSNKDYFYQYEDILIIQEQIMKNYLDKFILNTPNNGNQPIEDIMEASSASILEGKSLLFISSIDGKNWQMFCLLPPINDKTSPVLLIKNSSIQQGHISKEDIIIILNRQNEIIKESDNAIFTLKNMQIIAQEFDPKNNIGKFVNEFANYQGFCKAGKLEELRKNEFAKIYAQGIYERLKVENIKEQILTQITNQATESITQPIMDKLNGIKNVKTVAKLLSHQSFAIISGQTIGIKLEVSNIDKSSSSYEYYYLIGWSLNLTGGVNEPIIRELESKFTAEKLQKIDNYLVKYTPEPNKNKFDPEHINFTPKVELNDLYKSLCVDGSDQDILTELIQVDSTLTGLDSESII